MFKFIQIQIQTLKEMSALRSFTCMQVWEELITVPEINMYTNIFLILKKLLNLIE